MTLAALRRTLLSASLFVLSVPMCRASDPVSGVVTSSGKFFVDGSEVSYSSTVFEGSRIQAGSVSCTLTSKGGGKIEIYPQSQVVAGPSGVTIVQGQVEIDQRSDISLPATNAKFKPSTPSAVFRAQLVNNELTLDLLKGSAQLTGAKGELYARLRAGSRMQVVADKAQAGTVDLLASGCIRIRDGHHYLGADHLAGEVELLGSNFDKDRLRVEVVVKMQRLLQRQEPTVAVGEVLSEKVIGGVCAGFIPVGGLITTAVGVSTAIPILVAPRLSVP